MIAAQHLARSLTLAGVITVAAFFVGVEPEPTPLATFDESVIDVAPTVTVTPTDRTASVDPQSKTWYRV